MATTALFLASVFLSVGGGRTTIQEAYDIMVNLTILIYFLPYLYLFAAFLRLRTIDESIPSDAIVLPGGKAGAWAMAGCGMLATLVAMGLVFVPPPGTENVLNYEANLIGQAAVLIGIGMAIYFSHDRSQRSF